MPNMEISLVGLAAGIGGNHHGCNEGPNFIKQHMACEDLILNWRSIISPRRNDGDKYAQIASVNAELGEVTFLLTQEREFFVAIGGDHSCAIGAWSGVAEAKRPEGDVGLIWFDAHMSAHTHRTAPSTSNVNEMSLAARLGFGDPRLTQLLSNRPKLKPANVVLIGTRSYSPEEEELLRELGVKIFFAEEVNRRGVEEVLKEGITHISQHTVGYGISLDLDCFNPEYVQAVSDPVSGGIDPIKLLSAFETVLPESPPLGIGLSEYNPWFDQDRETFAYIQEILLAISLCQQTEKQRLVPLRG